MYLFYYQVVGNTAVIPHTNHIILFIFRSDKECTVLIAVQHEPTFRRLPVNGTVEIEIDLHSISTCFLGYTR